MTRVLPPLHDNHAPIHLHQAFEAALDAYEAWGLGQDEPSVPFEGRSIPISSVFGRMRTCLDVLPERLRLDALAAIGGNGSDFGSGDRPTFADAALILRGLCVERLRDAD
jgi:hypothetical protein